jgi:gamma-glutamylputrescine oxidase
MGDNRLLLGGGSLLYTYASQERHNSMYMMKKLTSYWKKKFPNSSPNFEYIWPGLIGVSKDLMPIVGRDAKMPSVYYVVSATGLPWAAALGAYSAEHIINNDTRFDHYFSPYRSFTLGPVFQGVLGKKITFALSHFLKVGSL